MKRLLAGACLTVLFAFASLFPSSPLYADEEPQPAAAPPAAPACSGEAPAEEAQAPPLAPQPSPTPAPGPETALPPPPPTKVWDAKTVRLTAGIVLAVPAVGYGLWWHKQPPFAFHFTNERWFQIDTYAGGADKASHITASYMAADALRGAYRKIGKSDTEARLLSIGVVVMSGVMVEVGDGVSHYGFSWEDLTADFIGALISDQIHHYGLKDTLGLRFGVVKALRPDPCCTYVDGYGDDYSAEVFTFDVKLAGLLPRMGGKPGAAKFLLLSGTYGTKGYRHSLPEYRQRNIGIEVGLNLPEILMAFGMTKEHWIGKVILTGLTYIRLPYTSFGWHYDLNHKKWNGPDTGDQWFPGP